MIDAPPPRTAAVRPPLRDFWRPIAALIIRELNTTYGRNPVGFVWMFLEPVGAILLLSVVFFYAMRVPQLGDSFALFYATGYLPYMMYMETHKKVGRAIRFSRALLRYPRVTFFDAILARGLLSGMTIIIVSAVVITAILTVFQASRNIDFGELVICYALAFGLGFSVGCINCVLFTRVTFWEPIWNILNRPMFIISGIFFIYEVLPKAIQEILWYNPVFHIVGMARAAFYPNYNPIYTSVPYVLGIVVVLLTVGLLFLSVLSRDYVEN